MADKQYWRKAKFDGKNYRIVKYYDSDCEFHLYDIYNEEGKLITTEPCYNAVLEWLKNGISNY